jgi:hypothetical protein
MRGHRSQREDTKHHPFTDLPEYTAAHVVAGKEEHRIILVSQVPLGQSYRFLCVFFYGAHRPPSTSQASLRGLR